MLEALTRKLVQGKKDREGGFYAVINDNLEIFFNAVIATQLASNYAT